MSDKISRLDTGMTEPDEKTHRELTLPNCGRIVCYHPFVNMQIIFYEIYSPGIPDLWKLGFRRGGKDRYLRTLICKSGECEFVVNGKKSKLSAGQTMMDHSTGDDGQFEFFTESFTGVEITMQVEALTEESQMIKTLRVLIESMGLPDEEIYDAGGYVFEHSENTEQALDRLLEAGTNGKACIAVLAQAVGIGLALANDLKAEQQNLPGRQTRIAREIYKCLTEDFGTKYTAAQFAEKYGVSDTSVKKYFKNTYGCGFKEYQTKVRMEWAAEMLASSDMKIGEISEKIGYARQTKFTKTFKSRYGITPLVYRRDRRMKESNIAPNRTERHNG